MYILIIYNIIISIIMWNLYSNICHVLWIPDMFNFFLFFWRCRYMLQIIITIVILKYSKPFHDTKQLPTPPDTSLAIQPCPNHTGHRKGRVLTWESSEGEELCGWPIMYLIILGWSWMIIPANNWFVTEFLSNFLMRKHAETTPEAKHTKSIHFCASSGPSSGGEVWTHWNS